MSSEWYYAKNKKQHGPVTAAELKELADAGDLTPTDKVWKEGMPQWAAASTIKGLFPPGAAPKGGKAVATPPKPAPGKRRPADEEPEDEPLDDAAGDEEKPRKGKGKKKSGVLLWVLLGGGGLLFLVCAGCGIGGMFTIPGMNPFNTVNVMNITKVKAGMSQAEVEKLMGPGKVVSKQTVGGKEVKNVVWDDGHGGHAEMQFINDKTVIGF